MVARRLCLLHRRFVGSGGRRPPALSRFDPALGEDQARSAPRAGSGKVSWPSETERASESDTLGRTNVREHTNSFFAFATSQLRRRTALLLSAEVQDHLLPNP